MAARTGRDEQKQRASDDCGRAAISKQHERSRPKELADSRTMCSFTLGGDVCWREPKQIRIARELRKFGSDAWRPTGTRRSFASPPFALYSFGEQKGSTAPCPPPL